MSARGPDDAALALAAWSRAVLAVRELEPRLVRALDELAKAQDGLGAAGVVGVELRFGREVQAAIQVRRGDAFWDRPEPEPTPSALVPDNGKR